MAYPVPQTHSLDGIPMNIYEETYARNFWVQSEHEWTLSLAIAVTLYYPHN